MEYRESTRKISCEIGNVGLSGCRDDTRSGNYIARNFVYLVRKMRGERQGRTAWLDSIYIKGLVGVGRYLELEDK